MQEQEKSVDNTNATEIVVDELTQTLELPDLAKVGDVPVDTVAQLERKVLELQDSFMRAKAEGENIRRRAQEDITKAHKFAVESFAEAMVPVKDSLEMALKIDAPTLESIKEGVEMTLKQLNAAFEKNRLMEINPPQGEKLDPMKHQAISMVPAEQDANTIVTVLQKGYTIADRLLRPALVTVAQAK
jgi:molecular chaperone GrpE